MKLIRLDKDFNIKVSSILNTCLHPEYVFIPMPFGFNLKIKYNEYIYKEQVLLENDDKTSINSPISGHIVGTKDCLDAFGKIQKCVVVENDFKENTKKRSGTKRLINNMKLSDMIYRLAKIGITNFSRPKEMLYKLFQKNEPIKHLIINAIDLEPYIASESFVLRQYTSEILEMIDALNDIISPLSTQLILKSSDGENVLKINSLIGTFPNIKLKITPDVYPLGNDQVLLDYLFHKKVSYDEVVIISATNVYAIYNALKRNRQLTERMITISGDAINNPQVLNVKIGTLLAPIIKEVIEFKPDKEYMYVANGLMTGKVVNITDLIVTKDMTGIIIKEICNLQATDCISCGKCFEVCPVNINPKYIMDNQNNEVALLKSKRERCISCGLCSYICPSAINLRSFVRGDTNE